MAGSRSDLDAPNSQRLAAVAQRGVPPGDVRRRRLSEKSKSALNSIRALSAMYVVVHHVVVTSSIHAWWTYAFRFGQEAVIVFFLLSGFLIYTAEHRRYANLRGYYWRRLRRIYPALLLALALSAAIAALDGTLSKRFSLAALFGNIFSLQDISALKPGVIVDPFMGNSPLWSLSYEVLFYALFPVMMKLRKISRGTALLIISTVSVAGYLSYIYQPSHFSLVLSYTLVWWGGAYLADLYSSRNFHLGAATPLLIALLALCCAATAAFAGFHGKIDPGLYPALPLRHFVATAVFLLLALITPTRRIILLLWRGGRAAAYVASVSYGLYVFHYPILVEWEWAHQSLIQYIIAVIILLTMAHIGDRTLDRVIARASRRTSRLDPARP